MFKVYLLFSVLFVACQSSLSQNNDSSPSKIYNVKTQRLLIKVVGTYLYNVHQWQVDYDSSIIMACKGEGLPHSLYRNESFYDGTILPGGDLIEKGNFSDADKLLTTLKGTDRIKLLLQLGAYYLFKPGSDKNDMDKAYNFLTQALSLSDSIGISKWTNASRTMLGKFYFQAGDLEKSKSLFTEVKEALAKAGDKTGLANALANRGVYALFNDTGKLGDISHALELFRSQHDTIGELEMLAKISEVHFVYGLFDEAEKDYLKSINIENEIGYIHVNYYYDALAYVEQAKGNYDKALSYANNAVASMERANDRAFAALFYFRVADIYENFTDFDKSSYWLRKSLAAAAQEENKLDGLICSAFMAFDQALGERYNESLKVVDSTINQYPNPQPLYKMYLDLARGLCYDGLNQLSLAEKYYAFAAGIADQLSSQPQMLRDIIQCYMVNAWFYAHRADKNKAKYYLQKALTINPGLINIKSQRNAALVQFKIDSIEGNTIPALRAYQRFKVLDDSIFSLRKTREIDEMGIQYGVAQKEKDLELSEKKQLLQQAQLRREKLTRNIIIIAAVLLAFLFALLYNRYRTKQRYNKEMDKKNAALEKLVKEKDGLIEDKDGLLQEKDWLVKEIHHRVKNNLQMVISLLNAQTEFLEHPSALNAIKESRERMQAIAILHQKLYQQENTTRINMRSYISELVDNTKDGFADTQRIYFNVDVTNISLDISQSVPLGLILNEAITNAVKYAYPKNEKGSIHISLQHMGAQQLQLKVKDHGKGLPANVDVDHSNSLGLQLIKLFAEQLEGDLNFINNNGLEITLSFKEC